MVQDPVCKVYVPKTNSLTTVRSGATYYFCSKECLEKFKSEKHEKGAEI
jgi:Cu+-exporting ATPase